MSINNKACKSDLQSLRNSCGGMGAQKKYTVQCNTFTECGTRLV